MARLFNILEKTIMSSFASKAQIDHSKCQASTLETDDPKLNILRLASSIKNTGKTLFQCQIELSQQFI